MITSTFGVKKNLLKGSDIFSSLSDPEIEIIAGSSVFHDYKTNDPIFLQGEKGNALYIVESGEIVVRKEDQSHKKTDLARFVQGNCFGELDMFTGILRTASAFASMETRLLVFPQLNSGFKEFMEKYPNLSAPIFHKILVEMASRIRSANTLIKENSQLVQELRKQIYRDKLTGLFNQTWLIEKMRELTGKKGSTFSLFILKPDNFKYINDNYGHDAGSLAISIMAGKLRDFIGTDKLIARYKSTAIAILQIGSTKKKAYREAVLIKEFMSKLDVSEAAGGKEFPTTASIGITLFPDHGTNAENLIFKAHELPFLARKMGGDLVLFPEDVENNG
ncbi:MAG: GGDEF domain-containing protein [Spirochaetota bacterium]|nr:GGDEF domain-containing protein [Spirochaetota bacterium]